MNEGKGGGGGGGGGNSAPMHCVCRVGQNVCRVGVADSQLPNPRGSEVNLCTIRCCKCFLFTYVCK